MESIMQLNTAMQHESSIRIPTYDAIHFIPLEHIIRIQSESNYSRIFLKQNKVILVSKTLKHFSKILSDRLFIRTHQSHLINKSYVSSAVIKNGLSIYLIEGTRIPVSRSRKAQVISFLTQPV